MMKNRRVLTMNEGAIIDRVQKLSKSLLERGNMCRFTERPWWTLPYYSSNKVEKY